MTTKVFPGGTNITRIYPKEGCADSGGGGDSSAWEIVQEFDWRTYGAHTFVEGVAQDFGGIDWTGKNVAYANADSPNVTEADGLKFRITGSDTATSQWFSYIQTGPVVMADLSDIVAGASLADTIAIQAIGSMEVNTAGTDDGHFSGGLYVGDGEVGGPAPNPGGNWHHNRWLRSAGVNYYVSRYGGGPGVGAGNPYWAGATGGDPPAFFELVLHPGTGWTSSMSLTGEFAEPLSTSTGRSYGNMELQTPSNITDNPGVAPEFTLRPTNMKIGLWASYTTATVRDSDITVKFSKFRVLKLKY